MAITPFDVVAQVGAVFDSLHVRWVVGGSVASSFHGIPRSTNDVDLVADLREELVGSLVAALRDAFYVSDRAISEAIRRASSFNLIHLEAMLKVDVFVAGTSPLAQKQLERRTVHELAPGRAFPIASAEDVILQKLRWFDLGARASERQWRDVLGILHARGPNLDLEYLKDAARLADLSDLLVEALDSRST